MATNRCATAKAPQVGLTSGPTQFGDEPRRAGNLDGYKLAIQSINSRVEHYSGNIDFHATMEITSYGRQDKASDAIGNMEAFLGDIETINKIKKADNPGVKDLWGQLQTLLTLSEE